ncbi:hypothetical protein A6A06_25305 [Streptomyces sp. CB02923]|uniref:terpene synthase family protein n=1 Tax=Streptomyces sp. CB02923 TaxID=1718985 RepID=UPI0009392FA3|nr:hypothetical protein [Streptomyces sp. CB02923]OKH98927.1 hypothetical protein A6A06_25305 [Streptomyces sp. CB02923]
MDDQTDAGPGPKPPEFYLPGPARLNPHVEEARSHCRAWAARMGILRSDARGDGAAGAGPGAPDGAPPEQPATEGAEGAAGPPADESTAGRSADEGVQGWDEDAFAAADYGLLAALGHPDAPAEQLGLLADWYAWRYYFADRFTADHLLGRNTEAAAVYAARLRELVTEAAGSGHGGGEGDGEEDGDGEGDGARAAGAEPSESDPVERALADLWARTSRDHGTEWRERFAEAVLGLVDGARWELANLDAGRVPNPLDYVAGRRGAGGGPWSAHLVEHVTAFELPRRVLRTRPTRVLGDGFADAAGLRADIVSYLGGQWAAEAPSNGVQVVQHFLECEPQQAVEAANRQLTSRLRQFERTEVTELPFLFGEHGLLVTERATVLHYVSGLRDWQAGFHEWLTRTADAPRTAPGGRAGEGWPPPPGGARGFGAAAGRLSSVRAAEPGPRSRATDDTEAVPQLPVYRVPFRTTVNPYVDAVRAHSAQWAREMGMVRDPEGSGAGLPRPYATFDEAYLAAADVPLVSALSFPTASQARLELAVDCSVWGTHVGDYLDRFKRAKDLAGARILTERLKGFTPDTPAAIPLPVNPAERGLADLWRRLLPTVSAQQRQRWRDDFAAFGDALLWQVGNAVMERLPDPVDYLEMRRASFGGLLNVDKVEYCLELEIPDDLWNAAPVATLRDITNDVLVVNNDAASYAKEMAAEGAVNNIVSIIRDFLGGGDPVAAARVAADLLDARVGEFRRVSDAPLTALLDQRRSPDPERQALQSFVTGLKSLMAGVHQWVDDSGRYGNPSSSGRGARPQTGAGLRPAGHSVPR